MISKVKQLWQSMWQPDAKRADWIGLVASSTTSNAARQ